jgi:hypothetical protein
LPHIQAAFNLKKFTTISSRGKTYSLDQRYQLFVFPIPFPWKDCQILAMGWFASGTATLGCALCRMLCKRTARARVSVLPRAKFNAKLAHCAAPGLMGTYLIICIPLHPVELCKIIITAIGILLLFVVQPETEMRP